LDREIPHGEIGGSVTDSDVKWDVALGADIFVPGHGPIPADPRETQQDLRRFRQMLVDIRGAVQKEVAHGATEDQAVGSVRWPQYEKMQSYDAQRETAVRRLFQQLTGALK
jgi:hypothetical protein